MTKYIANHTPLTPLLFLERAGIFYKDKIAIVQDNVRKTYGEFYRDCIRTSIRFRELGVKPGDRIAYISRNNYQLLEAHYAVPMCGAILVPINYRLNEEEVGYILRHAAVKILVIEEQYFRESYNTIVKEYLFINSEKLYKKSASPRKYNTASINEDATISVNYTSGTTGHPKGVMYSHRSTYLNALGECITASLTAACNYLWILPMFHCNGWCYTWAITAIGGTHFFIDSFDPEYIVSYIIEHQITHFCAAPTVLIQLQQAINFSLLTSARLTIITAGSSPAPDTIKKFEDNNIRIIHVYGLTETHGPHSVCEATNKSRQGIAGVHATFMNVMDETLKPVAWDGETIGELVVRGNNVMQGYYKDIKLTRQAFKGGWFHTGDLAVIHKDGHAEIVDRKKDIIISGGENISSIEVENVLYQHPDILLAAVIPVYDHKWGEIPKAVIELKDGKALSGNEIIDFCRNRLAHYKCPKAVIFEKIPKTNTGKIQKNKLKEKHYFNNV